MLRPPLQLALIFILGYCADVRTHETHAGKGYEEENIAKMAELRARWHRIHPVSYPPISEEGKAFLAKYSNERNREGDRTPSLPEINVDNADGVIEGDIIPSPMDIAWLEEKLREEEHPDSLNRTKRAAPRIDVPLFPTDEPISYIISSGYNDVQKETIRTGLKLIEENTCISFKEGGPGPKLEYTEMGLTKDGHIKEIEYCSSSVGDWRMDRNQKIHLGKTTCIKVFVVQHETMHALGFDHTMSRPDRANYVEFLFDKMEEDKKSQYEILHPSQFTNHSIPYEFNSVMHYGAFVGTLDGSPTLRTKPEEYITSVGADHGPTFNDWKQINIRYECSEKCNAPISCLNKGYQHPRECTRCVCPIFYYGNVCQHEHNVTNLLPNEPRTFDYEMNEIDGQIEEMNFTKFDKEIHVIKASEGERIRVTLNKIDPGKNRMSCFDQCKQKAVEIVDGDMALVGKRFCCADRTSYSFVSKENVVGYQVYSMPGFGFTSKVTFSIEPTSGVPTTEAQIAITPTTVGSEPLTDGTATDAPEPTEPNNDATASEAPTNEARTEQPDIDELTTPGEGPQTSESEDSLTTPVDTTGSPWTIVDPSPKPSIDNPTLQEIIEKIQAMLNITTWTNKSLANFM